MSKFFRSASWSSKLGGHALDSEEYVKKGTELLSCWKIPKVPTRKIYRRKPFRFFSGRSIKTIEAKVSCGNGSQAFRLITQNPIVEGLHDRMFYTMFNVGLIQIGVKTSTTKIPSNASIILCVRDDRHEDFESSILGMVESSLNDGPFYFNVFPNVSLSVLHPKVLDSLVLNVIVQGFEQLPADSKPISVICRTCYKLQSDAASGAFLESSQGKTVYFQTDVENSNVTVQKVSNWDEVTRKVIQYALAEKKANTDQPWKELQGSLYLFMYLEGCDLFYFKLTLKYV